METREQSERFAEMGESLVREEPALALLRDSSATVCYLESDTEKRSKGRPVLAECEKVPAKYRWAVPCDFTVTVFRPNTERLTDGQLRILLLHELLHIGIERDGNEETYRIAPHDVEDFREVIDRYGLDWAHEQA